MSSDPEKRTRPRRAANSPEQQPLGGGSDSPHTPPPPPAPGGSPSSGSGGPQWRFVVAVVVIAVLAVACIVAVTLQHRGSRTISLAGDRPPSGAASSGGSWQGAATGNSPSRGPVPAGCMKHPRPIVPVRYRIDRVGASAKVLSVGLDSSGAAGAPPLSDPSSMAWFNKGPQVGSQQGHVVMTGHTYHQGEALGNRLYTGAGHASGPLRKGDILRFSDKAGNTVCYRYTHNAKIWVKDYRPDSTVLYDDNGPSQLVLVACWDYKKRGGYQSRILFYGDPVA